MRSNTNRRQVVGPLTINSADWQAVELGLLGTSGILTNAVYRLDAGGTNANMEVKVICGVYDAATITNAAINAIPAEDVVYHETGIALTNSATAGTTTNIDATVGDAAVYDRRGGLGYSNEDRTVMLVVRRDGGAGALAGNVYVALSAKDVGR